MAKFPKKPESSPVVEAPRMRVPVAEPVVEALVAPRSIITIRKRSMRLYELVELSVVDDKIVSETVLKRDLPYIIISLLMRQIRNQELQP